MFLKNFKSSQLFLSFQFWPVGCYRISIGNGTAIMAAWFQNTSKLKYEETTGRSSPASFGELASWLLLQRE